MGILPCPLPCHSDKESNSNSNHLDSEPPPISLSHQPSLPSVPSLAPPPSQQHEQLSSAAHRCISTLKGHSSYVFSLALADKYLYSGSSNKNIRVWNLEPSSSDQEHSTDNIVAVGNGAVKSLVVLGDKLFSGHQDNKIRVWKVDNNEEDTLNHHKYKCMATLPTLSDRVQRLFSTKNYVKVRRRTQCTWVHHIDTISALALSKDAQCTWVHHIDTISALALSKDGSFLYSASWDRTFKIWQTSDFKCLESISNAHDDAINAIVVSTNDGGCVYTGSADRKIKVWKKGDQRKHALVDTLEKHKSAVNALALSRDGSVLYSGACDRSIIVWEKNGDSLAQMVVAGALRGHTKAILCLSVVSDLVCSGSADRTIRVWKRGLERSYSCLAVFEGHRGPVKCLTVALDNYNSRSNSESGTPYLVYSGSLDCDIKVWQILVSLL